MLYNLMLPLLAPIAKSIFSTVDKVITSKAEKEKIKAELQHKIITGDLKEIEAAATVIQLEAQGTWLQKKLASNNDVTLCRTNGSTLVWIYSTKHS